MPVASANQPLNVAGDGPLGERRLASSGRSRVEYHVSGTGPSVVLLPALAGSVREFNPLVSQLNGAGYRTLGVHLAGVGQSQRPFRPRPTLFDFADDVATVLADAGVLSYNAFTTQDHTEYFEVVPPAELPVALWIEADRMAHPIERVYAETFTREREVVKNEWRERYDNVPYGHVSSIVRAARL